MRTKLLELAPPGRRDMLETATKKMNHAPMPPIKGPIKGAKGVTGQSLAIMSQSSGPNPRLGAGGSPGGSLAGGSLPAL